MQLTLLVIWLGDEENEIIDKAVLEAFDEEPGVSGDSTTLVNTMKRTSPWDQQVDVSSKMDESSSSDSELDSRNECDAKPSSQQLT